MNHMRNIKEMLSIPTGNRNVATNIYSSFTDSQIFFGSQFWPENSQSLSQDVSLSSRTSQQSSQEGSDPKISTNYHTKPLLFGDLKDKTKALGLLDTFEEDKKKTKEQTQSAIFAKECLNIQETLNNIQQLVAGTEKNTTECQTVLGSFNNFASTLQNNLSSLKSDISQQFETVLNKVNSQTEMITELEEKMQKRGDTTGELALSVQSLKNSLECLREEQKKEQSMLEEALKLLNALVSAKPSPRKVMDTASQISPSQDNKFEGTQFLSASYNLESNGVEVPLQNPSCITGKKKSTLRGIRRDKKRLLVVSQRSKRCIADENFQPVMNRFKQNVSKELISRDSLKPDCLTPPNRKTRSSETAGCFINPLSCWSPESNGSEASLPGIESILEKLSGESKKGSPVKPESFWQLFDMDCVF